MITIRKFSPDEDVMNYLGTSDDEAFMAACQRTGAIDRIRAAYSAGILTRIPDSISIDFDRHPARIVADDDIDPSDLTMYYEDESDIFADAMDEAMRFLPGEQTSVIEWPYYTGISTSLSSYVYRAASEDVSSCVPSDKIGTILALAAHVNQRLRDNGFNAAVYQYGPINCAPDQIVSDVLQCVKDALDEVRDSLWTLADTDEVQ